MEIFINVTIVYYNRMAWNQNQESRESEYNELAFKMARINKLQDKINILWQNPKGVWNNPDVLGGGAEYGFVLIFSALNSLYKEVKPKCTKDEKHQTDTYVASLSNFIEDEIIFSKTMKMDKSDINISKDAWKVLKEALSCFEDIVRNLLDVHGYAPDKGDDEGL